MHGGGLPHFSGTDARGAWRGLNDAAKPASHQGSCKPCRFDGVNREQLLRIVDAVLPQSVVLPLAILGTAISTLVVATTFVPGGPLVPTWVVWPLFLGCFPVHLRSIRMLPLEHDFKQRLLDGPRGLLVVAAAIGACALVLMIHGFVTSQGNPERHGRAYYLRNHTELTRVSHSEYRYAERLLERSSAQPRFAFTF
jgi:hypothetical protein